MTTAIEQAAKREQVEQNAATLAQAALARANSSSAAQLAGLVHSASDAAVVQRALAAKAPGLDPQDFQRDHRIHVKDGSLFIDPYLVLNSAELAPVNEARLRDKLRLTYTVNNPSFFESAPRRMIALGLGQLVPHSLNAKYSKLMELIKNYNTHLQTGTDPEFKQTAEDRTHPFAAIVRETLEKPHEDPIGMDTLKNGLGMYLLVREKLTKNGYLGNLSDYVNRAGSPDQVLGELAPKIGVDVKTMRDAAARGGLDAVGATLGLDPAYVADVKNMVAYAETQDFGFNVIEHWHLGRQRLGIQAPLQQKIAHGLEERITNSITQFRAAAHHSYDVPAPVKAEEKRIADCLNLLEPIQRMLMHKLGYEICFTPEYLADDIAKYQGIYGLHRKAASDLRDIRGTYRIYFSARGELKDSMRTLVHEVAHNLWPEEFTPDAVKKIDALAQSDAQRFTALKRIMDEKFHEFDQFLRAYQAGSDAEKAAIVQTTKSYFAGYGVSIDEGVLPYLRDANELKYLVDYASARLSTEGVFYPKTGYESGQERFREVLSRFAEVKQVELSGNPQLMQFLAPGLNQVWEAHYIPHLKRVYQKVVAVEQGANDAIAKAQHSARGKDEVVAVEQTELPKVAQRPTAPSPVKETADACIAENIPQTTINAPSTSLLPALSTLQHMGVQTARA